MPEHALLGEDIDIVSLVANGGRNVLRLLRLAEPEEEGLVLNGGVIPADGELIAVGTPSFVIQKVIPDAEGSGTDLIGQGVEPIQPLPLRWR